MFTIFCLHTDYELEKKDYPDELVDLSSTLSSQGTMDFVLVRNISKCELKVKFNFCAVISIIKTSLQTVFW